MAESSHKISLMGSDSDLQRTQTPYVTGTSVIGIKYKDGILIAIDTGALLLVHSYVSDHRYLHNLCRGTKRTKKAGIVGKYGQWAQLEATFISIFSSRAC